MNEEIKNIIFNALQDSYVDCVIIHKIDNQNSAIEMDYHKIAQSLLDALFNKNYKITKINNQE
jgi:hypothetical protein